MRSSGRAVIGFITNQTSKCLRSKRSQPRTGQVEVRKHSNGSTSHRALSLSDPLFPRPVPRAQGGKNAAGTCQLVLAWPVIVSCSCLRPKTCVLCPCVRCKRMGSFASTGENHWRHGGGSDVASFH